ncbi:MAG: DUF1499 domain-containing protein [Rhodoferax sp.]|nr:DUF1499 domain-containing protein [Rhodoferax sp.]MDP3653855.1 DUF1499 domain-containing protein [Rhodoferax sp.]
MGPFKRTSEGDAAKARIARILKIKADLGHHTGAQLFLRAQQHPALNFTDSIEFRLDPAAGVIQVRSASRLGRSDFNVNRVRGRAIRAQFTQN